MFNSRILITAALLVLALAIGPATSNADAAMRSQGVAQPAVWQSSTTAVYIEAGSTGDGRATQAHCDKWTAILQSDLAKLQDNAENGGSSANGDRLEQILNENIDSAMNAGCFVIY